MVCALLAWSESLSYHHPQPEKIELTSDEFKKLEAEIQGSNLNIKTKEMLIKSIHFMIWLQWLLEHAKLSIKKLHNLFGIIPRIRKKIVNVRVMKKINLQLTKVRKMMKAAQALHPMILQLMKTPPITVR